MAIVTAIAVALVKIRTAVDVDGFSRRCVVTVNEYDNITAIFARMRILTCVSCSEHGIDPGAAIDLVVRFWFAVAGDLQKACRSWLSPEIAAAYVANGDEVVGHLTWLVGDKRRVQATRSYRTTIRLASRS